MTPRRTVTWKGWRLYVDGALCVATDGKARLTTKMPPRATEQHSFYLAVEQLKNDIRNRSAHNRLARRAQR